MSRAVLAGFALVAVVRALTLPRGLWELDEIHFAAGIERFEPLAHSPHPPGYPLLIGLGKLFALAFGDPFTSLVALSLLSSLVSYPALLAAFRRIAGEGPERIALAGALLYLLSPVMLVQGPLPMSDPPSMMFVALSLAAAAFLHAGAGAGAAIALGACASGAVGCRPSNAVAVIPMLAVALWQTPSWRRRTAALAAFTTVSLLWLVPLVVATGGFEGFLDYQLDQVAYVAQHDASATRAGRSFDAIAARFVANPWGPRWLALPVIGLAIAGSVRLVRRRRTAAAPLAALSGTHLAFCLAAMDPGDGARYALPVVLGMALATAVGCEALADRARRPGLGRLLQAVIVAVSIAVTLPVLVPRAVTQSPVMQAVEWAAQNLPAETVIMASEELAPHAAYLLRSFRLSSTDEGLLHAARRPRAPVYRFAEGDTGWAGATTFAWPPSEAFRRLTRNHYRVVSLAPVPAHWRFEPLRGIHGWEPDLARGEYRRLDAHAALLVYPRGASSARVKLAADPSAPAANPVTLSVNGASAADVVLEPGAMRQVEVAIPSIRYGSVEIGFHSVRSPASGGDGGVHEGHQPPLRLLGVWTEPPRHRPGSARRGDR